MRITDISPEVAERQPLGANYFNINALTTSTTLSRRKHNKSNKGCKKNITTVVTFSKNQAVTLVPAIESIKETKPTAPRSAPITAAIKKYHHSFLFLSLRFCLRSRTDRSLLGSPLLATISLSDKYSLLSILSTSCEVS